MTTAPHRMARPGYTLRIGADLATAVGLIEQAFVARGFRMNTAAGALPAELAYGSAGVSFLAGVLSDNGLPVIALPSIWNKRKVMKVRILALEPEGHECALRVDSRSFQTSAVTTQYFLDSVSSAVELLERQGLTVAVEGPTDSGRD